MQSPIKKLKQWRQLAGWERSVWLGLAWRLPAAWILLRICSLGWLLAQASRAVRRSGALPIPSGIRPLQFARRCEELVCMAARHGLYTADCLPKSLALGHLLACHGLCAELKVGVLPKEESLQAHAWVEFDGVALGEDKANGLRFHVFPLAQR